MNGKISIGHVSFSFKKLFTFQISLLAYVLLITLYISPVSVFAAEKLVVKDSQGVTRFSVTDDGTVTAQQFIGTQSSAGGGGDVDTWTRNLALPVGLWTSYGDIVVDASKNVYAPSVLYRNNQYELFYAVYNAQTAGYDLYLTTSADGLTNWSTGAPVFSSNSTRDLSYSVFYNRAAARYECFFSSANGSFWDIKFMWSTDGRTNWSAPVTAIAGSNVGLGVAGLIAGDSLYLVFARTPDNKSLKLWTSRSPYIGFVDRGIVISNAPGTWEDGGIGYPSLYQNNGNIYCLYAAYNAKYQIGSAFQSLSQILGTTAVPFNKDAFNPIISENNNAHTASLIQVGSEFRLYYAYMSGGFYRIKLSRIVLGK
jgi:hypothetical protein